MINNHVYIVDFVDENSKILYEIKPSNLTNTPKVIAKTEAAIAWCNDRGYKYIIITENEFDFK